MAFVKEQTLVIDMLINNAGLSGKTAFADTRGICSIDDYGGH